MEWLIKEAIQGLPDEHKVEFRRIVKQTADEYRKQGNRKRFKRDLDRRIFFVPGLNDAYLKSWVSALANKCLEKGEERGELIRYVNEKGQEVCQFVDGQENTPRHLRVSNSWTATPSYERP